MTPINLSEVLKPYEQEWVALEEGTQSVIAHGKTLKSAQASALEKGVKHPVFTFVPSFKLYFAS